MYFSWNDTQPVLSHQEVWLKLPVIIIIKKAVNDHGPYYTHCRATEEVQQLVKQASQEMSFE